MILRLQDVLRSGKSAESPSSRPSLLIVDYVLKLAALDGNIDIRDRARWYKGLLAFHIQRVSSEGADANGRDMADQFLCLKVNTDQDVGAYGIPKEGSEDKAGWGDKYSALLKFAERVVLAPKPTPVLPSLAPERSAFVVGSMSHVVLHRAPNYCSLPEPLSIEVEPLPPVSRDRLYSREDDDFDSSSSGEVSGTVSDGDQSDRNSSPRSSGSFYEEENGETHPDETPGSSSEEERSGKNKSQVLDSSRHGRRSQSKHGTRPQHALEPLINLYDSEGERRSGTQHDAEDQQNDFGLLSATRLDDWLSSSEPSKQQSGISTGFATVSIGKIDAMPRLYTLLDFTNGGGLDVKYCIDGSSPTTAESALSIKLYLSNQSSETISDIGVTEADSAEDYHEIGYVTS
jgi:AP-3 complex subunit beta